MASGELLGLRVQPGVRRRRATETLAARASIPPEASAWRDLPTQKLEESESRQRTLLVTLALDAFFTVLIIAAASATYRLLFSKGFDLVGDAGFALLIATAVCATTSVIVALSGQQRDQTDIRAGLLAWLIVSLFLVLFLVADPRNQNLPRSPVASFLLLGPFIVTASRLIGRSAWIQDRLVPRHSLDEVSRVDRFQSLDGWRGICACLVAFAHITIWLGLGSHLHAMAVFDNFYLFVDFFFVLSGFVIAHAYEQRLTGFVTAEDFVVRRFGRLWPLHMAVIAVLVSLEFVKLGYVHLTGTVPVQAPFTQLHSIPTLFANLVLVQAFGFAPQAARNWNFPSWSISTEFYTYILFAGACLVASRFRRHARDATMLGVAFTVMLVGAEICILRSYQGTNLNIIWGYGLFRCILGFFAGYVTHRVWLAFGSPMQRRVASVIEIMALSLVTVLVLFWGASRLSFAAPLVFSIAIFAFAGDRGILSRAMNNLIIRSLGLWSYSIYMIHTILIELSQWFLAAFGSKLHVSQALSASPWLGDFGEFILLGVIVFAASLTYTRIEKPCRRAFNDWSEAHVIKRHMKVTAGQGLSLATATQRPAIGDAPVFSKNQGGA